MENEYELEREKQKLGPFMTCCIIFKATIGVGIFTFQYAYGLCGLVLGTAASVAVFYMVTYGIDTLLGLCDKIEASESGKLEAAKRHLVVAEQNDSYSKVPDAGPSARLENNMYTVEYELLPGKNYEIITYHQVPNRIRGRSREIVTLISIIASVGMCLGFGLGNYVYLIKAISDSGLVDVSESVCSSGIFVVLAVLQFLIIEPEKIKYLALVIAVLIFSASVTLLGKNSWDALHGKLAHNYNYSNPQDVGIVVGVALFAFESISLIINVRRTTRHKHRMRIYTRWTFGLASVFFLCLALSFHLVFGKDVTHPIAFDFYRESDKWLYYMKFLVGFNPLFAVPFSTITIIEIFEKVRPVAKFIQNEAGALNRNKIFLLRFLLLASIYLCTLLTTKIEIIFDIVGSLFGPIIGFLVPVYIYHQYNAEVSWPRKLHDLVYCIVSVVFGVLGVQYTFRSNT